MNGGHHTPLPVRPEAVAQLLEAAEMVGGWVRPAAVDGWVFTVTPEMRSLAIRTRGPLVDRTPSAAAPATPEKSC